MNKLLNPNIFSLTSSSPNTFGGKEGALYPLFEDLDGYRVHFIQRKREIEDLIYLLSLRVEAEAEYSQRLFVISDRDENKSITCGMLGQEVESFKADCRSKAKAAAELADNVAQDCVHPLKVLIDT